MHFKTILASSLIGALSFGIAALPAFADTVSVNFENPPYVAGSISGQD